MSYPEKGASYRNKPAWMDRAVAGEKRAQGGPISIGNRTFGNGASVSDVADAAADDAKEDLSNSMSRHRDDEFWDGGTKIPGRQKAANDKYMDRLNGTKRASGGPVRRAPAKRAVGGATEPLIDSKGRTTDDSDNEFIKNEPPARLVEPSSPRAAQDAREQASSRTRRTRAMPGSSEPTE